MICEHCRKESECEVKKVKKEKEIKGETVKFVGKEAYCKNCGKKVFVDKTEDYNIEKIKEKMKNKKRC